MSTSYHELHVRKGLGIPLGLLGSGDALLRVSISSNVLVLADNTITGIGILDEPKGSGQPVIPRQVGRVTRVIASEAIGAFAPCYAAANGKVASTGTVVCGYSLESASTDGDRIEMLWS